MTIQIAVNGIDRSVDVDEDTPLLWVLRDVMGMTGTKFGCGLGLCGACTIHIDGQPARSCITPIAAAVGKRITQCGYCQSGQIMSATALLAAKPNPTDSDIDDAMSGNVCRCGTYLRIRDGIKRAARVATNDKKGG